MRWKFYSGNVKVYESFDTRSFPLRVERLPASIYDSRPHFWRSLEKSTELWHFPSQFCKYMSILFRLACRTIAETLCTNCKSTSSYLVYSIYYSLDLKLCPPPANDFLHESQFQLASSICPSRNLRFSNDVSVVLLDPLALLAESVPEHYHIAPNRAKFSVSQNGWGKCNDEQLNDKRLKKRSVHLPRLR